MRAATWTNPTITAPWPGPPSANSLGTFQLVGDLHLNPYGETYPDPAALSAYDALGRDMRDRLIIDRPLKILQMGDLVGGSITTQADIYDRFVTFNTWLGDYGLTLRDDWDLVMGNHDTPGEGTASTPMLLTASGWASYWGYATPSYTIDNLGAVRVIVLNPTGVECSPPAGRQPIRPVTPSDIAWLDARLDEDTRPTIIATHAPMNGMGGVSHNDEVDGWKHVTASTATGIDAPDLLAVLDAHDHLIGWMNGHTHSRWYNDRNQALYNTGSRSLVAIDASATYTQAVDFGGDTIEPTTYYVSILDDGKTVDVRWRTHDLALWDAHPSYGRVAQLTAT